MHRCAPSIRVGFALWALSLAGCQGPTHQTLPTLLWADVREQAGERRAPTMREETAPAEIPSATGGVLVLPVRMPDGSLAAGAPAFGELLRSWAHAEAPSSSHPTAAGCTAQPAGFCLRFVDATELLGATPLTELADGHLSEPARTRAHTERGLDLALIVTATPDVPGHGIDVVAIDLVTGNETWRGHLNAPGWDRLARALGRKLLTSTREVRGPDRVEPVFVMRRAVIGVRDASLHLVQDGPRFAMSLEGGVRVLPTMNSVEATIMVGAAWRGGPRREHMLMLGGGIARLAGCGDDDASGGLRLAYNTRWTFGEQLFGGIDLALGGYYLERVRCVTTAVMTMPTSRDAAIDWLSVAGTLGWRFTEKSALELVARFTLGEDIQTTYFPRGESVDDSSLGAWFTPTIRMSHAF